jgi:hypothetical protein
MKCNKCSNDIKANEKFLSDSDMYIHSTCHHVSGMSKMIVAIIGACTLSVANAHDIGVATQNVVGFVKWPALVTSQHHARLINNTDSEQIYHFIPALCVDNIGCTPLMDKVVKVGAHKQKLMRQELALEKVYNHPGRFGIRATTDVIGDGGAHYSMDAVLTIN